MSISEQTPKRTLQGISYSPANYTNSEPNKWQYVGDGIYHNQDTDQTVSGPIISDYQPGETLMRDPGSIIIPLSSVIMDEDGTSNIIQEESNTPSFEFTWDDDIDSLTRAMNYLHERGIAAEIQNDETNNPKIVITQDGANQLTDEQRSAFIDALKVKSKPLTLNLETPNSIQHVFKTDNIDVGNMQDFLDTALTYGIPLRITSGVDTRPNNSKSLHPSGNAIDVTPLNGEDWNTFTNRWSPEFLKWMDDNGYKIYDELDSSKSKDWTGPHRHISKIK